MTIERKINGAPHKARRLKLESGIATLLVGLGRGANRSDI
jgi:hypothetical protein